MRTPDAGPHDEETAAKATDAAGCLIKAGVAGFAFTTIVGGAVFLLFVAAFSSSDDYALISTPDLVWFLIPVASVVIGVLAIVAGSAALAGRTPALVGLALAGVASIAVALRFGVLAPGDASGLFLWGFIGAMAVGVMLIVGVAGRFWDARRPGHPRNGS